jgi:hypothetical protein
VRKTLTTLIVLIVILGLAYVVRARGAAERAEAAAEPLFVPVLVTPSVQLVNGQMLLYKATNVSERAGSMRLMLFNDHEGGVPGTYEDFTNIPPGNTVSYLYEPPKSQLTLGATQIDVPEAVRAIFAPLPGDDPGAIRRIVANVQIMRIVTAAEDASPSLEPPIMVPLEHCNFEPRGFVPYTGGRWYWNCAPQMYPFDERWRSGGQNSAGAQ